MGTQTAIAAELKTRLRDGTACVAVIGLGYVGLPLVRAFHEVGYRVIGYDKDPIKIEKLQRGETYLKHLGDDLARGLAASEDFTPTFNHEELSAADAVVLCVPTPLGSHREPDLSFVQHSAHLVAERLRRGQLVVLSSTTYPGTTRKEVLPILQGSGSGLVCGQDFFLAYSPEREDPGREGVTTAEIPRLVGGVDEVSTELAYELFSRAVHVVLPVESAEVAEAAKLLENVYRAVNIALANELKIVFSEIGIDVWKVIQAASTKPFGFQAFYPGPGLGGHCIPIDPFYLTWRAKEVGVSTRFIELAGEVNSKMPAHVVSCVISALNRHGKALSGSQVLICGIAYKRNVDDARETPAAEIIERLSAGGALVSYYDPHIPVFPRMRRHEIVLESQELSPGELSAKDCVLVVTDHDDIDWDLIGAYSRLIVDTRNVMERVKEVKAEIVKA